MHGDHGFEDHPPQGGPEWWGRKMDRMMRERERRHGHRGGHGRGGYGPWSRYGGFPGEFLGPGPRVGRGDVRAAILVLLAERSMHGYQVIQELTERSGGMWRPSPGSVYPTLQQLEDEGLVRSSETEGRRVYELTDSGRADVQRRGDQRPPWDLPSEAAQFTALREEGFGVFAATMQVARTGDARQIGRAKTILADARKSLYRLLAGDDDPRDDAPPSAG